MIFLVPLFILMRLLGLINTPGSLILTYMDGSDGTEQRRAADHRRRDGLELPAIGLRGIADADAGREKHADEGCEHR